MAAFRKKRKEEDMEEENNKNEEKTDNSEDDCMDSDGDDEEAIINEEVQVDFEARVPEDSDFHGIKNLLKQVFLKAHVNTSELTEVIISQNYIGSVVKQTVMSDDDDDDDDDDNTVMAVTTVINITERQDIDCVKQLKALLEQKCQECAKEQKEKWFKILHDQDQQLGYLINERFINLPPNLAVPIFESLVKEMEKARQKKMKYDFNYFLMLCKTLKMTAADDRLQQDFFFINSEEEIFRDASELNFSYSVAEEKAAVGKGGWSSEEDMDSFRTVLLIPAEKLFNIIQRIKDELATT